jgi:hypothetical protein
MASGKVTRTQYFGSHYNEELAAKGKLCRYIDFVLKDILNPQSGNLLFTSELQRCLPGGPANFAPQCSGVMVKGFTAEKLETMWVQHLDRTQIDSELWAFEGEESRRLTLHRKRENQLREAKIAVVMASHNGKLKCEVPRCGFDFAKVYGEIGVRYAQVHHAVPLAKMVGVRKTHLSDLRVVCANCHTMIHHGGECRELNDLIPQKI